MNMDKKDWAEGVVYPNREFPEVPEDARCQEVFTMIGNKYVRCGRKATCVIDFAPRTEIYYMCAECGSHNAHNRGGKVMAGGLK